MNKIGRAPDVVKTWLVMRSDNTGEMCSDEAKEYLDCTGSFTSCATSTHTPCVGFGACEDGEQLTEEEAT